MMNVDNLNSICGTTYSAEEWEEFLRPTKSGDKDKKKSDKPKEKDAIIVILEKINKTLQERNEIENRKAKALESLAENQTYWI